MLWFSWFILLLHRFIIIIIYLCCLPALRDIFSQFYGPIQPICAESAVKPLAKTQFTHQKVLFTDKLWPTPLPTNIVTPNPLHTSLSAPMYIYAHCLCRMLFLSIRPISTAYHLLSGSRTARLLLNWLIDWSKWTITPGPYRERIQVRVSPFLVCFTGILLYFKAMLVYFMYKVKL